MSPQDSKGKHIIAESNHTKSALESMDLEDKEGIITNNTLLEAQDLHAIFNVLLEPCIEL